MRRSAMLALLSGSALVAGMLAGAVVSSPVASAATDAPIVGMWTHSGGGAIQVTPSGDAGYVGVVTSPINFGACTHPAGERIWNLTDTRYPNEFTGTHVTCSGSTGRALARLDDVDNAATPTIRLDLYVDDVSTGALTRPGTLTSGSTGKAPTVRILAPDDLIRQRNGVAEVTVKVKVRGAAEVINWQINVFNGGSPTPVAYETGQVQDHGGTGSATFRFKVQAATVNRAFYTCAWAMNDSEDETRSANAPYSSCAWLKVEQRYLTLAFARQCALPVGGDGRFDWMSQALAVGGRSVDFSRACALLYAGYHGWVVQEPLTKKWYDFRTWSRAEVDDLFRQMLQAQCRVDLAGASARVVRACIGGVPYSGSVPTSGIGANTYYTAWRSSGRDLFDSALNRPVSGQGAGNLAAALPGGQRDNS